MTEQEPKDFVGAGLRYVPPGRQSTLFLNVLPELHGVTWCDVTLAYVSALKPSVIRVVFEDDGVKCDVCSHRVTVILNRLGFITSVHQELDVQLPAWVHHGHQLEQELKALKNSYKES